MIHGRGALPVFRMGKLGGNFLGLEFRRYAAESEMLQESTDSHAWAVIQKVKGLTDAGIPIRQIAEQLGLSKSAAHRYLQMWHPSQSSSTYEGGAESDEFHAADPPVDNYDFPGREEYGEAADDPRFDKLFEDESPENYLLRREAYLIESACSRARRQYHETGIAPPLNDDPAYSEFMGTLANSECGTRNADSLSSQDDIQNAPKLINDNQIATPPNPLDLMELVIDDYGKERFVESKYENGKLRVWYQHRSDGALLRHEHRGFGLASDLADPAIFGHSLGRRGPAAGAP